MILRQIDALVLIGKTMPAMPESFVSETSSDLPSSGALNGACICHDLRLRHSRYGVGQRLGRLDYSEVLLQRAINVITSYLVDKNEKWIINVR